MAPITLATVRHRRLRPAVAATVALATLTIGTTAAPASQRTATQTSAPATGSGTSAEPTSPYPGFLLDHGRYTAIEAPEADVRARGAPACPPSTTAARSSAPPTVPMLVAMSGQHMGAGHRFRTRSDTEVVLRGCLERAGAGTRPSVSHFPWLRCQ